MNAGARCGFGLTCIWLIATHAWAAPLTDDEVLNSSVQHFPKILEQMANQRAAAARVTQAEGAFDLVFEADGFSRVEGFYDGTAVNAQASQPLRPLGAELYTGYKLSDGTFPIYEDINYTNTGGALRIGALFSLLRDRSIDERRFNELDSRLGVREQDLDLLLTRIGVQQKALMAYWRWVAVGRQLEVYKGLLEIALERQENLREEVASGARAEIFLTENEQNIVRRQALVTAADRDLNVAANALSYYYRDANGMPVVPGADRLPPMAADDSLQDLLSPTEGGANDALLQRPELKLLQNAIRQEQNRIALSENDLKPRLDFDIGVQKPFGDVAEGGISRNTTDMVVGFQFSVPLQRRSVKGRLRESQAQLEAIKQQQRLTEDRIRLEVRNILLQLQVSGDLLDIASQEVSLSWKMRDAEVERFSSGASDFFLVNIREETAANAQVRLLQAELDARLARADFDAATVNLDRLGIVE